MEDTEDLTVADVLETLTEKQKETFRLLIGYALNDPEHVPDNAERNDVTTVLNAMNEMQLNVLYYEIGLAFGDTNSKVEAMTFLERVKN